jgi:protein phosphatase 1 regulatory subunit 7
VDDTNKRKLSTIDISSNKISKLENLSHLAQLNELWASGNQLSNFNEVEKELKHLSELHTVYFEGNPLQLENRVTYRNKVRLALGPSLQQIDATFIRAV